MIRRIAMVVLAVLVTACAGSDSQQQPSSSYEGLQLTGRYAGAALSLSDGAPEVVRGDCDAADGVDEDLCLIAVTLDGAQLALVFENPALLTEVATLDVVADDCGGCDPLSDGLVVEVRAAGQASRAVGGQVTLTSAGPVRLAGQLRLRFADGGTLSGTFDVGLPVTR